VAERAGACFRERGSLGENRLVIRTYLTDRPPPAALVSSVRAVVFRRDRVAVIQDGQGSGHVVPGGRTEPGETQEQALRREVLEECGWTIGPPRLFAVLHLHHLTPKPPGHDRPYPDFLQPVFAAEADAFHRRAIRRAGEIETGSRMTRIGRALSLLEEGQRILLTAALASREGAAQLLSQPPPPSSDPPS
jgi:8-oxo-dGTP pyrophosphatase MutT (NUDIX family)